jgi:hypothetical protein
MCFYFIEKCRYFLTYPRLFHYNDNQWYEEESEVDCQNTIDLSIHQTLDKKQHNTVQ